MPGEEAAARIGAKIAKAIGRAILRRRGERDESGLNDGRFNFEDVNLQRLFELAAEELRGEFDADAEPGELRPVPPPFGGGTIRDFYKELLLARARSDRTSPVASISFCKTIMEDLYGTDWRKRLGDPG